MEPKIKEKIANQCIKQPQNNNGGWIICWIYDVVLILGDKIWTDGDICITTKCVYSTVYCYCGKAISEVPLQGVNNNWIHCQNMDWIEIDSVKLDYIITTLILIMAAKGQLFCPSAHSPTHFPGNNYDQLKKRRFTSLSGDGIVCTEE